jgi:hypothetical protein
VRESKRGVEIEDKQRGKGAGKREWQEEKGREKE